MIHINQTNPIMKAFLLLMVFSFGILKSIAQPVIEVTYEQAPLPYEYNALEEVIDASTMEIHYTRHAATYCKNLNDAAASESMDTNEPLEWHLRSISKFSMKMRNNAGGHYNHEIFWKMMRKPTANNLPTGELSAAINKSFGSFEKMKQSFSDAAKGRFGSGWAWLYINRDGKLEIGSTPNQDNPLMDVSDIKGWPILCLDIWEHAYYLKYQNKRADYIENWWKLVNWDYVATRWKQNPYQK
jgi:Fe-Mn family superoxide dismutase